MKVTNVALTVALAMAVVFGWVLFGASGRDVDEVGPGAVQVASAQGEDVMPVEAHVAENVTGAARPTPGALEPLAAAVGAGKMAHAPRDPRGVWLHQTEGVAQDLLDGRMQLSEAAAMLADLLESVDLEQLEWTTLDGVRSAIFLESDGLGTATLRVAPHLTDSVGEFEVALALANPPGSWAPGEAHLATLDFKFALEQSGQIARCTALLQTKLNLASGETAEGDLSARPSGGAFWAGEDGTRFQSITAQFLPSGDHRYTIDAAVEMGTASGLNDPQVGRLSRYLAGLRRDR